MPAVQNLRSITVGPLHVKIYSEELGGCFYTGCLNTARLSVARGMRPVICSSLDPPVDYRPMQPGMGLSLNAKELSALNMVHAWGSGGALSTTKDDIVGDPTSTATVANKTEFHIVRLPAATGPWDFTMYTENRELFNSTNNASASFVKATDIQLYFAAPTDANGVSAIAVATALYELVSTDAAKGSFYVSDPCTGKITLDNIPDAVVTQYTYDSSAAPFKILGQFPIIEDDVQHGDTVAIVGIAYKWGYLQDAAGTRVPATDVEWVEFGNNSAIIPVSIRGVHFYEKNRLRDALVIDIWKGINMSGFGTGFDASTSTENTLDFTYTAIDDSRNHPTSPMGMIRQIHSNTDLSLDTLL